jgi:hypothetical protein
MWPRALRVRAAIVPTPHPSGQREERQHDGGAHGDVAPARVRLGAEGELQLVRPVRHEHAKEAIPAAAANDTAPATQNEIFLINTHLGGGPKPGTCSASLKFSSIAAVVFASEAGRVSDQWSKQSQSIAQRRRR